VFRKVRLGIELFALVVRCNGGVGKPDRVPFRDAMVDVGGSCAKSYLLPLVFEKPCY